MKLFTAEGFSFALQITSLILLIGYSASKTEGALPMIRNPKAGKMYPSYFKIKHESRVYEFPYLHTEISKIR